MTINAFTSDTNFENGFRESFGIDLSRLFISQYKNRSERNIEDVVIQYAGDLSISDCELTSTDMTETSMILAPSAFSLEWNNEDDEYWDSYLN